MNMSSDDITHIHKRLDSQDATLQAIHSALVGNEALGHRGLVSQVRQNTQDIEQHTVKLLTWGGVVTGMSLTLGLIKDKILGGS